MKTSKILVLVLAIAMVFSSIGFAGAEDTNMSEPGVYPIWTGDEPAVVTVLMAPSDMVSDYDDNVYTKKIEDLCNVDLQFVFLPSTDAGDKLQYLRGTIATGDRFVSGNDMKSAVIAATQADCVEMEGAAVAHIAAKNGVPCLVLRAISDNCDEAYDALSARTFDLETYAQSASRIVLDIIARIAAA